MEISHLRDFLALASSGNFSRAAEQRNVTQPAFSRRIRALEEWVGSPLFDRRVQPVRLTDAGARLRDGAEEVVRQIDALRDHAGGGAGRPSLSVAAQHSIAVAFIPNWLAGTEQAVGRMRVRVWADDLAGCVNRVMAGECDLAMIFHHNAFPLVLNGTILEWRDLAPASFSPYAGCDRAQAPIFYLPATGRVEAPVLLYQHGAALGWLVNELARVNGGEFQNVPYENALADALRSLAIAGAGIAWLPDDLARTDVAEGRLALAGGPSWRASMTVRLLRRRDRGGIVARRVWRASTNDAPPS
jgi:LysR family transcriptional regulator, hypochlorite-specific transcription factor HypT